MANKKPTKTSQAVGASLESYMERIGAEQRNFRRWVIKEEGRDGYHHEKFIIKITAKDGADVREAHGGSVPKDFSPTPEEAAAIKIAVASANWPKSIQATRAQFDALRKQRRKEIGKDPILFPFWNEAGNAVLFVQERVYEDNGVDKNDFPWSLWNDRKWHRMEPDGDLLPLYGLENLRGAYSVFLHEGAKTADFVGRMLAASGRDPDFKDARAACPWIHDLMGIKTAHIGWPGGAPNPHRVDWSPLQKLAPGVRVVQVCDNDPSGESAARYISRALKRRMSVVRFGDNFPRGFDLANEFPLDLYENNDRRARYEGPSFYDCLESATWATKPVIIDKKVDHYELRREFVEEWWFTVKPLRFINRGNLIRQYSTEEFNTSQAAYSDVPDLAKLLKRDTSARAEQIVYEPKEKSGRIALDEKQVVNLYTPSKVEPIKGDVQPWLDFLTYLIPEVSDREKLMRWIATLIARPDIRLSYSVLMISEKQGVGKTTLAERVLMPLVGDYNCSTPNAERLINSQFNDWAVFKRLVVIGEIYDGESAKAYNRLKGVVTDGHLDVNQKYQAPYRVRNHIHIYACSNSSRALKLAENDRRWLIPGVTEFAWPHEKFVALNEWLDGDKALPAIAHWAAEFVKKHGNVKAGEIAPDTAAKLHAIEAARSIGEQMIVDLAADLLEPKERIVIRQDAIRLWLASKKAALDPHAFGNDGKAKLELPATIASLLKHNGLKAPKTRFKAGGDKFRIVATFAIDDDAKWDDIQKEAKVLHGAADVGRWLKDHEPLT